MSSDLDGLLLVDKPSGPTSHDLVNLARRATGQRRIGHTGTLDPLASGLLALVLGRATRLARFLPQSPKEYGGTLELGRSSATDDCTGEILTRHDGPLPAAETVCRAAAEFLGRGSQRPPAFSARKVDGQRLYRLARKGVRVDAPAADIEVFDLSLAPSDRPEHYTFSCEVSSGTYVRGLVRDLGERLGCGAMLTSLRRTRIGPLGLDRAVTLPGADPETLPDAVIPLEEMPLEAPTLRVPDESVARQFALGGVVEAGPDGPPDGPVRVLAPGGRLLGMADSRAGRIRPRVVVAPAVR